MVDGHEAPGRIDLRAHHVDGQVELLVHQRPVVDGSAAERVDAQAHAGGTDHIEVDDVLQIGDIVLAEVEALDQVGLDGLLERNALDVLEIAEQLVGTIRDGVGDVGRSRAAGDRVILEAAIGRRLCDGVTTMPSARPSPVKRWVPSAARLWVRMAWDTTGVGVKSSRESMRTVTPLATSTSMAVFQAGSDSA